MKQLFLAVCLLVSAVGFAKIPKPQKNTYVNDFAGVLKPGEIRELNAKIHRMERLADVQLAVVLINKLPAEYDIDEYALLIGRKWHVGKHKNGLVYVAAIAQHKQRLEVARLLTDKVTDEKSAEILDAIKPFFRQQDYAGGINAMVDEVTAVVVPAKPAAQPSASVAVQRVQAKSDDSLLVNVIAGIIMAGVFFGIPALVIWIIVRAIKDRRKRRMLYRESMFDQQPIDFNNDYGGRYGNGPIINNYNNGGGYRSSGMGSAMGGFAAGYAARTIQDHLSDDYHHNHHNHNSSDDSPSGSFFGSSNSSDNDTSVNSSDDNSSSWGNWGSSSDDSSSSSSDDSSSSSSDSGYDGDSGATSDW
jgi:uncharacterized protein